MKVDLSRRALRLTGGDGEVVMPLTAPINDLIGLRAEPGYCSHLRETYRSFWPSEWSLWFQFAPPPEQPYDPIEELTAGVDLMDVRIRVEETLQRNLQVEVQNWQSHPRRFLDAAKLALSGRYSAKLAHEFERIKRH